MHAPARGLYPNPIKSWINTLICWYSWVLLNLAPPFIWLLNTIHTQNISDALVMSIYYANQKMEFEIIPLCIIMLISTTCNDMLLFKNTLHHWYVDKWILACVRYIHIERIAQLCTYPTSLWVLINLFLFCFFLSWKAVFYI